jgi:hypothetical protein
VDHVAGGQVVATGDARFAGRAPVGIALDAFGEQVTTGGAVDRAVDPAAAAQPTVRGVDDGVDRLLRQVALDTLDAFEGGAQGLTSAVGP